MKEKQQYFAGKNKINWSYMSGHEIKTIVCKVRAISVRFLLKCYQLLQYGLV